MLVNHSWSKEEKYWWKLFAWRVTTSKPLLSSLPATIWTLMGRRLKTHMTSSGESWKVLFVSCKSSSNKSAKSRCLLLATKSRNRKLSPLWCTATINTLLSAVRRFSTSSRGSVPWSTGKSLKATPLSSTNRSVRMWLNLRRRNSILGWRHSWNTPKNNLFWTKLSLTWVRMASRRCRRDRDTRRPQFFLLLQNRKGSIRGRSILCVN